MRQIILSIILVVAFLNIKAQSVNGLVVWNKSVDDFNGDGTTYKVYVSKFTVSTSGAVSETKTEIVTKDTFTVCNYSSITNTFWKYRIQAIDSLGTVSSLSDPIFSNKDTNFIITNNVYKNVYDTVIKVIYKYSYDTIEVYDTVIRTFYNKKYNITKDTVKIDYPTDTLLYNVNFIDDIVADGYSNFHTIFVEIETGRVITDKDMLWNGAWTAITYNSYDDIIDVKKFIVTKKAAF